MIEIEAVLEPDGTLRACKAEGHAGAGKSGGDIVCAAVSVLIRTAVITLSNKEGITLSSDTPEKGKIWLKANYEAEGKDFLHVSGQFLLNGLSSVAREYPKNCKLTIKNFGF